MPPEAHRFKKGQSGNPRGKPKGSRNKSSLAAEALLEGSLEKIVGPDVMTFPAGSSLNLEVTTLNQTVYSFIAKANSKVYVQYIIETI